MGITLGCPANGGQRLQIDAMAARENQDCQHCHWTVQDPAWQRTSGGACRRCGYCPGTGQREPLEAGDAVLTPQAVAHLCGLSRRRVYDWIACGWLRAHRVGGRWFVTPEDLTLFTATCRGAFGYLMPQLWDWSEIWRTPASSVPA